MDIKEYRKIYYQKHKDELNKRNSEYRKEHAEEIKQYKKKYRESHKKEVNDYSLKYYYDNYEKAREWAKKNYYNNREKRISYNLKYYRKIKNKIIVNLRIRIYKVLKGISKSESTMRLLGCNVEQLKNHLQSKFQLGMTWNNYGLWHIDHIRPCVSFDLSKVKEQRKCFHYTNLQPLWAFDNLSKNDKILGE
jgi:hypothetical protein